MDAFKTAFSHWLDTHSHSLRAVAIAADLANGELSRIRTGAKSITLDSLTKLLPAIERLSTRSHARALLVAYLHDETPQSYQPDIRIYAIDDTTGSLDRDDITIARDRWEAKARADAEFAKMWLTLDGYMHEPDAAAVDARLQHRQPESDIALLSEKPIAYKVTKKPRGSHPHDAIRHDAMPSQHAAQEHHEP